MEPLTEKQLLSKLYVDLALGYVSKYDYDEFVGKIIHEVLKVDSNNLRALQLKLNYHIKNLEYVMEQLNIGEHNFQNIKYFPKAVTLYKKIVNEDTQIRRLGFKPMPQKEYEKWLKSLENNKNKQETKRLINSFKGSVIKD